MWAGAVTRYRCVQVGGVRRPHSDTPRVAAVVLTWNGLKDTHRCLDSLERSTYRDLRIVVVDNGSIDGTQDSVNDEYPGVILIENKTNLGFAEGNNIGIRHALNTLHASFVFLLNNDAWVEPDTIGLLVRRALMEPRAGVISPLILFPPETGLIWFAGARFDPDRARSGYVTGYREPVESLRDLPEVIDRATGAAMLVTRETVDRTGAFDGALFFLYEDVDWSLRIKAAGLRLVLEPTARVYHRVSGSQGESEHSPTAAYYGTRNQLEIMRRYGSGPPGTRIRRELGAVVLALLRARRSPAPTLHLRSTMAGWWDFRRGRFGPRG